MKLMKLLASSTFTALLVFGQCHESCAQPFLSGSDGSYGPMNITTNTVLDLPADGIFRCTSITVNENALNARVKWLAVAIEQPNRAQVLHDPSRKSP